MPSSVLCWRYYIQRWTRVKASHVLFSSFRTLPSLCTLPLSLSHWFLSNPPFASASDLLVSAGGFIGFE